MEDDVDGESLPRVGGGRAVAAVSELMGDAPEGVDACNVANRSGVEGAARPKLHAIIKKSAAMIQNSLFLVVVQFDGFKVKFLPR